MIERLANHRSRGPTRGLVRGVEGEGGAMTKRDRIIFAKFFLLSMQIMFAILYRVANQVDPTLYRNYEDLSESLKEWTSPKTEEA